MTLSRRYQWKGTLERRDGDVVIFPRFPRLRFDIDAHAVGELDAVHDYAPREPPVGNATAPGKNSGAPRQLQCVRPQHDERSLDMRRRSLRTGDSEIARDT